MADRAENRSVDLQLARRSEGRLVEVDVEPDQRVLPTAYPRTRPATARAARRTGPCPPKNASMMSVNENPAPAPAPPKPAPLNGSPPRSYIRRFSGSESTS